MESAQETVDKGEGALRKQLTRGREPSGNSWQEGQGAQETVDKREGAISKQLARGR